MISLPSFPNRRRGQNGLLRFTNCQHKGFAGLVALKVKYLLEKTFRRKPTDRQKPVSLCLVRSISTAGKRWNPFISSVFVAASVLVPLQCWWQPVLVAAGVLVAAMQATCFLALLSQSSFITAASSIGTLEVTENPCKESHSCVPRESCSSFNESIARLRILPSDGSQARAELIRQLRKLVCNKEKRGVCCLPEKPENVLQPDESQVEDDNEEKEEEVGPDLKLYPNPLLSAPRPRLARIPSKCCK